MGLDAIARAKRGDEEEGFFFPRRRALGVGRMRRVKSCKPSELQEVGEGTVQRPCDE